MTVFSTKPYTNALEIARLIILNFSPNISSGNEKMLALLFDMNSLWEAYILVKLKSVQLEDLIVKGQESKTFWNNRRIQPDIVLQKNDTKYIIDTKWKNIGGSKPNINDLRQMYVYNRYWHSYKALLLYPSIETEQPNFIPFEDDASQACAIGRLNILKDGVLNDDCGVEIIEWFLPNEIA